VLNGVRPSLCSEQLVSLSNKVSAARQRRRSSGSGWGGDSPLQLSGGGGSGRAAPAAVPMSATPQLSAINSGQQAVGAAALLQGGARPKNAGRQRAPWQRHQAANLTSEVAAECTGGGGSGRSGSGDLDAACHSRQALQQPSGPDISVSDVQSAGGGGGAHTAAETAAAFLSSITTAFIEGPVELFRHREQASFYFDVQFPLPCMLEARWHLSWGLRFESSLKVKRSQMTASESAHALTAALRCARGVSVSSDWTDLTRTSVLNLMCANRGVGQAAMLG